MTASADTPASHTAERSHEEVQQLLRAEIDSLKTLLDERFRELAVLTDLLEKRSQPVAAAPVDAPAAASAPASRPDEEGLEEMQALLHDVLQASLEHGPANGVPAVERQVDILAQSPLFDAQWYLQTYEDVQAAGMDPREHYVRSGAFEGRNPGPGFDSLSYYLANPDVAEAGWPALVHFAGFGQAEGRRPA